jgi:hypothetical protein
MSERSIRSPSSHTLARHAVSPAAHSDRQPLFPCELDGDGDVCGIARARDQAGPLVDHRVPDLARLVVSGVARRDDLSTKAAV